MTFAAVGSTQQINIISGGLTFPLTVTNAGDLIVVELVVNTPGGSTITALSSADIAWDASPLVAPTITPAHNYPAMMFKGKVTAGGTPTITVTFSGTAEACNGSAHEFSTTAGYANVLLDTSGVTSAAATFDYPTLVPGFGAGELYYGYAYNDSAASAGSTPGYTYFVDGDANGTCFDAACTNASQTPVWADTFRKNGLAVLLYEQAPAPAAPPANYLNDRSAFRKQLIW